MAVVASIALATANRITYLLTSSGATTGSIPNNATAGGGTTPNLSVDCVAGPIKQIAFAAVTGIGALAAGALNQAKARSLLLSDGLTAVGTTPQVPRTTVRIQSRAGAAVWDVDANVNGSGDPILDITASAAGTAYLTIDFENAVGG